MKKIILRLAILSSIWVILGSTAPVKKTPPPPSADAWYYWFWADDDSYFSFHSVADEIDELESWFGVLVNTSPGGGTLIARGYVNNVTPHNTLPAAQLYTH